MGGKFSEGNRVGASDSKVKTDMPLPSLLDAVLRTETRTRLASFHLEVKRRWGTLTPGGAICHLAVCYELVPAGGSITQRTGLLQRTVFRYGALHVPLRWPKGYPTLPELVEGQPGVRPGVFDQDRARLLTAFDQFIVSPDVRGRAHPIFGPLTQWEWMRWGYLHADHHLRQFGL